MSITFRIATPADDSGGPIATINARQLAAFRSLLREEGERIGVPLLDPDADEERVLAFNFEARVCPLAIATIARVFDFDAAVISVLDEAQYRGRRVIVWWYETDREIRMRPSLTSDCGAELDLANGNALALLESLGFKADSVGEIPANTVRARLDDPAVRLRAAAEGFGDYMTRLDALLATVNPIEASRLEWA